MRFSLDTGPCFLRYRLTNRPRAGTLQGTDPLRSFWWTLDKDDRTKPQRELSEAFPRCPNSGPEEPHIYITKPPSQGNCTPNLQYTLPRYWQNTPHVLFPHSSCCFDVKKAASKPQEMVTVQNSKPEEISTKPDVVCWEIEVPKALVGRLIGKQGRFMNFLKQESGAKIYVSSPPHLRDSQVCHIEGFSQQVEKALEGVPVEVVVANQVDAGHMFLQQHTHPTFRVLHRLGQQMNACYSQPDVELRYVDYGGYDRVKINQLRKIRSDFLSLPFQAAEVLLDNVVPLADEDHFSPQADAAVVEMTKGAVLVAQATDYDSATGLPLVELWNLMGDEMLSVNRALVERGLAQRLDQ
ncbi:A-kinase anchor protein 1, mitochondrial-like [Porphyrio hochstetteri]